MRVRLFAVVVLVCGLASPLYAFDDPVGPADDRPEASDQIVGKPAGPPPVPEHTGIVATLKDLVTDVKHLPSLTNLMLVGVGAGAAAAVHPADDTFNQKLDTGWAKNTFGFGAVLGQSPTLLGASAAIYAVGRYKDDKKMSHMGSDLLQSIAIAELMTQTLKYSVRRERPDGSGANSFPSGHAADTFAFATAIERHFGWKLWVPAYAGATYVAMSRLHDNRHYLSDVAFGAAVGAIAGRTVTRQGHGVPFAVTSVPGGAAIVYVHRGE